MAEILGESYFSGGREHLKRGVAVLLGIAALTGCSTANPEDTPTVVVTVTASPEAPASSAGEQSTTSEQQPEPTPGPERDSDVINGTLLNATIICEDGEPMVGAWITVNGDEHDPRSGWMQKTPTTDPSVMRAEKLLSGRVRRASGNVGCGGTPEKWGRSVPLDSEQLTGVVRDRDGEIVEVDITCGEARCDVAEVK